MPAKTAEAPKPADHSPWWLALAGVVGAVVGGAITGGFNYLGHLGDRDAKMIELSVGILRTKPTPETIPLREWAIDVVDKRAGFSFTEKQRAVLLERPLPTWSYGGTTWGGDRWGGTTLGK